MKKEHIIVIKFAALLLIVFFGQAFTYALIIPYLTDLGYNAMQQGWIFAFGAVLTIIGQFICGYLCDKLKTDKKVYYVTSVAFMVVNWLFYSVGDQPVALVVLWAGLLTALFRIVLGIQDAWIIECDKYCLENYGLIRAFGAIGWTIGALVMVYFVNRWGYTSLGTSFVLFTVISLLIAMIIPDAKKEESAKKLAMADVKSLMLNRNFIILTLVFLFLSVIGNADGYTVIGKMTALQATTEEISWKWSFQAMCELPLFFLGGWIIKKFGAVRLVIFAAAMYVFRFALSAMVTSPIALVGISAFQMVTYPIVLVCSKQLIDDVSPANLRASGQQISSALYTGISMLVSPILSGFLVESYSHDVALYVMAACCIIPIVLLIYYSRQKTVKQ